MAITQTPALLIEQGDILAAEDGTRILLESAQPQPTPDPSGTISVGTGSVGTRFIETDWPIEVGLVAGTTRLE